MARNKTKSETSMHMKGRKGGVAMHQQEEGFNPMLGAAVGAVIGGAVGAAAAVALSNEETRHKVADAMNNLQKQAADRFQEMTQKARERAPKAIDSMVNDTKTKKEEK